MNALIFGASGQTGRYLAQFLRNDGATVLAASRGCGNGCTRGDVSQYDEVERLVKDTRPAYVFHLAANSTTRHGALRENHETIVSGTWNVLEAVKRHCPAARVFITGSGLQFKNIGAAISESDPFEASSAYSASRIASVYAARYFRSLGTKAYVGYLFHHESPFRKPGHVSQMIAGAARRIADGAEETLELGDLSVRKEWTFAGDVARGILTLTRQDDIFEAAIGSGIAHSIQEWLEACFTLVGRRWDYHVRLRGDFRAEYRCLFSDPATILSLGWSPQVSMHQLAEMMVSRR